MSRRILLAAPLLLVVAGVIAFARRDRHPLSEREPPPVQAGPNESAATRVSNEDQATRSAPVGDEIRVDATPDNLVELCGRVQTADAKPVTSFTVIVYRPKGNAVEPAGLPMPFNSSTGEFRILVDTRAQTSDLSMRVSADQFDDSEKKLKGIRSDTSTDVGAFVLQPLVANLAGIVVDSRSKRPIADAHLIATFERNERSREIDSKADGTFQFGTLPDQEITAVLVWAEGHAPRSIEVTKDTLVDDRLYIELVTAGTVRGIVTGVGDVKLDEMMVVCWDQKGWSVAPWEPGQLAATRRIASNGEFKLEEVATEPLFVGVRHQLRGTGLWEVRYFGIQSVTPREGEDTELDFHLGTRPRVRVPIRATAVGTQVLGRLFDSAGMLVSMTECQSGSDLVLPEVAPGRYEIRVSELNPYHFLSRMIDVAQRDLDLEDWDIDDMPR